MEIVVVSDTHRDTHFIEKILKQHPNAKYFLHAGDSELNDREIYPFETVKGNCDYFIRNKYKILDVLGVKIFMVHGDHLILDDDVLFAIAKNNQCDIIIHGHTHRPYYRKNEDVHILCPGSLVYPRSKNATYAVITFKQKEDICVEIKDYE